MEILRILVQRHIDLRREENVEFSADEALGQLVAKFVGWNGLRILRVAGFALNDAGLLADAEIVNAMAKEPASKSLNPSDNGNS